MAILTRLGLRVLDEGSSCDASLKYDLHSEPLGAWYEKTDQFGGVVRIYCELGQHISGEVTLAAPDQSTITVPIDRVQNPPESVEVDCKSGLVSPNFWPSIILESLTPLWGADALIQALPDQAMRAEAEERIEQLIGPESSWAVPALARLLESDDCVRSAARLLGRVGPNAKDAIPGLLWCSENYEVAGGAITTDFADALKAISGIDDAWLNPEDVLQWWLDQRTDVDLALSFLTRVVQSPRDSLLRTAAVRILGKLGTSARPAVPALLQAITQDSSADRYLAYFAILALADIDPGGEAVVSSLVTLLQDENTPANEAEAAILALGSMGPAARDATPLLVTVLLSQMNDAYAWENNLGELAAWSLGKIGPATPEVVPALIQAFDEGGEPGLSEAAAEALGMIGPEAGAAVPVLIAEADMVADLDAALALSNIGPGAVPELTALLNDPDSSPRTRLIIAWILNKIGEGTASQQTWALVQKIRQEAVDEIKSQSKNDTTRLVSLLTGGWSDREGWWDRDLAAELLVAAGPEAVPALVDGLAGTIGFPEESFFETVQLRFEYGTDVVSDHINHEGSALAHEIIKVLDKIGEDAVPGLIRSLDDEDPAKRRAAIAGLLAIGPEARESIPVLIRALDDDNLDVRSDAHRALQIISGVALADSAAEWQRWWEMNQ